MKAVGKYLIIDVTKHLKEDNIPVEVTTESGLIISNPELNKAKDSQIIDGKIISISSDVLKTCGMKVGDVVLIPRFFGSKYEENDKVYAIIEHSTVYAIK